MLLGYRTYAELSLASKMAPDVTAVERLLEELRQASFAAAAQDLDDLKIFARTQEPLRRLICVCGMSPFGLNGCVSTMPLMMKSCVPTFFTARARRPVCASRAPLWAYALYQPMAQPRVASRRAFFPRLRRAGR